MRQESVDAVDKAVSLSEFSKRLCRAMAERNVSVTQLAAKTGIAKSHLSRYRAGVKEPMLCNLMKLPGNPGVGRLPVFDRGSPYAYEVTNALGERELIFADSATPSDLKQPYVPLYR